MKIIRKSLFATLKQMCITDFSNKFVIANMPYLRSE